MPHFARRLLTCALVVGSWFVLGILGTGFLDTAFAVDGNCPHQGRDPNTVTVPPTTSAIVNNCDASEHVTVGGMSGSSQTSWSCPTWETTGFSYNPVIPKLNIQITKSDMVHNLRVSMRCARPTWLFGLLYSNLYCEDYRTDIIETQITVFSDGYCPGAVGGLS